MYENERLPNFLLLLSVNVYVPKDRVTNLHQGYGFVEFRSEEDADYVSDLYAIMLTEIIGVLVLLYLYIYTYIFFFSTLEFSFLIIFVEQ